MHASRSTTSTVSIFTRVVCDRRALLVGTCAATSLLALAVLIPVLTIPGNSVGFQLSLLSPGTFVLYGVLAVTFGFLAAISAHRLYRARRASIACASSVSFGGSLSAGVVASATCASCLTSLLGVVGVGVGGVSAILSYRAYIVTGAIALTLVLIVFSLRALSKAPAQ